MIPAIDLGSAKLADQIRAARRGLGFFYVKEHGVPDSVRRVALDAARAFFALSGEEKIRVAADARHRGYVAMGEATLSESADTDFKESFVWGPERDLDDGRPLEGPNQWPARTPELGHALTAYLEAVTAAGMKLLAGLAESIDLPSDFYTKHFDRPLARGSVIHYPPSATHRFGTSAHTDYGCVTLLWQDDVGGLQVEALSGEWVDVAPVPGTLVVNIGDLMARWTNGRFRSTKHRVLSHASRDRYSMAVFFDANYDTVVDGVVCGEYVKSRFDDVFAYRARPVSTGPNLGRKQRRG